MKYLVKLFVVTFLVLICTHANAEEKIAYIDMKYILNNSKAGKGAQDFLKESFTKNQKIFTDAENKLKEEEKDLLTKKNIITKEEYQKKIDELRKKVIDYQSKRRISLDKITKQRADARAELLKKLDPILKKYVNDNNISIIIDKKNVIMGSADFDLTNIIIEKLNKELPALNLE
jgi:outer membrane protein